MLEITLKNLPPFDGKHELDFNQRFTKRELHWIKEIAGVRVNEFAAASAAGDSDLLIAFTIIALTRKGTIHKEQVRQITDLLMDAPDESMEFDYTPDEDDARPPETQTPTGSGQTESNGTSSSVSSSTGGDLPATGLGSTGHLPSDTIAESPLATTISVT